MAFFLSNEASRDLDEIFTYLSDHDVEIAREFIREMMRRFDLVAVNPGMGAVKSELILDLRMFPFRRYNIFYFEAGDNPPDLTTNRDGFTFDEAYYIGAKHSPRRKYTPRSQSWIKINEYGSHEPTIDAL